MNISDILEFRSMADVIEESMEESVNEYATTEEPRASTVMMDRAEELRTNAVMESPSSESYDTDLEIEEEKANYDTTGRQV